MRYIPSISLFMMIPVSGTITLLPKSRLIVVISEMARPVWSTAAMCDVPGLGVSAMSLLLQEEGDTYVLRLSSPSGS